MLNLSYLIIFVLSFILLIAVGFFVYRKKEQIDEMHGMMVGMTFGMLAGMLTATFIVLPTGNFLNGIIWGSLIGLVFGIPFGKLGGHLGIMEGIMAGPMGGMMGAMLGQMIRPFNISIFIPFFELIFIISLIGISYAVNCQANCCGIKTVIKKFQKPPKNFIWCWSISGGLLLIISFWLPFSFEQTNSSTTNEVEEQTTTLPPALRKLIDAQKEVKQEAVVRDGYQEIDLRVTATNYSPNVIIAKKGIPLKIHATAAEDAGCGREIIFPDFNINKIIPTNETVTIEINPTQSGEFGFRCAMDMVKGKLIIN